MLSLVVEVYPSLRTLDKGTNPKQWVAMGALNATARVDARPENAFPMAFL